MEVRDVAAAAVARGGGGLFNQYGIRRRGIVRRRKRLSYGGGGRGATARRARAEGWPVAGAEAADWRTYPSCPRPSPASSPWSRVRGRTAVYFTTLRRGPRARLRRASASAGREPTAAAEQGAPLGSRRVPLAGPVPQPLRKEARSGMSSLGRCAPPLPGPLEVEAFTETGHALCDAADRDEDAALHGVADLTLPPHLQMDAHPIGQVGSPAPSIGGLHSPSARGPVSVWISATPSTPRAATPTAPR